MSFCRPYKTLTNGTITSNRLFVAEDTLESQDHSDKLKGSGSSTTTGVKSTTGQCAVGGVE